MKTFSRTLGAFALSGALVFSGAAPAFAVDASDTAEPALAAPDADTPAPDQDADAMPAADVDAVTEEPAGEVPPADEPGASAQSVLGASSSDTVVGEGEGEGDGGAGDGLSEDDPAVTPDPESGDGEQGEGTETPQTPAASEQPEQKPQPKQQTTPKLAFRANTTFSSIKFAAAPASKEGVKPKYSLDKKKWQSSTKFKELKAGTKYTVYVTWPGNSTYAEIPARTYGKATTKYVKVTKIKSMTYTTKKKNILKGRKRHYIKATFAFADGTTLKYRYKVGGSWAKWAALPSGKTSVALKLLGTLSGKKRNVTVEVRAYKKGKRVGFAQMRKKGVKIGAYKLDNIGQMILDSALKYTTPNYYYLMSGYDRYRKYSSKRTTGIDCSGLVSCALRDLGNSLYTEYGYQVSTQIAANSKKVSGSKRGAKALAKAKPGDAIYWGESGHWIGYGHNAFRHICFYAGKIDGVHYIIDSYPWSSGVAGYDYCKKLCKNPKVNGKKNKFHHGVNYRPITKREIKQIRSIHRFY